MVSLKIIISNHISELLKMQLESRSRNVHTKGIRSGFISTQAVTTQKGIRASAFVLSWYIIITALSIYLSSGALQHTVHTSIIADKIVSLKIFFRAPIFRSGPEARSNKNSNTNPVSKKCRQQIADRVQNAD